jgi:hypothetical protein
VVLLCGFVVGSYLFLDRIKQPQKAFHDVPQELLAYRETNVLPYLVKEPAMCFAVQDDSTFIVGTAEPPVLHFFDDQGTPLRTMKLPEEPRAIVYSDKGIVVVAHPQLIAAYTTDGDSVASWALPDEKSDVRSLVLTPDYLFAADTGKRCIYRFERDGKRDDGLVLTFRGGFVVYAAPMTMTFSPGDGLLYITNPGKHRIEVFTQDGEHKPELSWGHGSTTLDGFAGCCNPIALAALDDGRVLTVEKAISRVKIFGTDRKLDCVVAGPQVLDVPPPGASGRLPIKPGRQFTAMPLSDGRIAVFDFEFAAIRFFAPI